MKIAFIVSKFPSLSETFILNQMVGLVERGHQVDVFASESGHEPTVHEDVEKYHLLARTFYHGDAHCPLPANALARFAGRARLIGASLPHYPLPLLKSLNAFKFGKKALSLSLLYKTQTFLQAGSSQYDIIHCHFGPNGYLGALLKDVGAIRGKLITTFHGYDVSKHLAAPKHSRSELNYLFGLGDLFLPISERWKKALIEFGCPEQKVRVHRMGIDPYKFIFAPRTLPPDRPVRLLTIARLVEKKGVQYGIQAVARVLQKYPRLEYDIVGDGPLKDQLQQLIDTLNIQHQVKLLGWKRQQEVVTLLAGADILLAPSVTGVDGDQEGIPVVLMEALAQGLPVLSTHHSGIPELVQDGQSGFLVPERDVEALVAKLEYLLQQPAVWSEMGRAGRRHVEACYDINKLNEQLVDIFRGLLATHGRRSDG